MTKLAIFAVPALALAAAASQAQETKPIGLSIRAGLFFPSNGNAKDAEGSSWFAGGLELKVKDVNWKGINDQQTGHLSVSLDYIGKGEFKNIPILLNYVGRNNEWFYTAGIGASFSSFEGDNRARLGYQLGLGYDFTQGKNPIFLEAKYWGTSKSEFNGFGIYAGIRL